MFNTAEFFQTIPNVGDDDFDSDLTGTGGETDAIFINTIGDSETNIDGGYFKFGDFDLQPFEEENPIDFLEKTTDADKRRRTANPYPNTFAPNTTSFGQLVATQVFPNPTTDILNFQLLDKNEEGVIVELRNSKHQLIKQIQISPFEKEQSINIAHLPNGIYYAYFISPNKIHAEKIIKVN